MTKLNLLRQARSNFVITDSPPQIPLVNEQVSKWYSQHGIVFRQGMSDDGRAHGFNMEGTTAIVNFAKVIFLERPEIRAGTRIVPLANTIAAAIESFGPQLPSQQTTEAHVAQIEEFINQWFERETIPRTFLIPCDIVPDDGVSFSVGPIQFLSILKFASRENIDLANCIESPHYGPMLQTMQADSAIWLAEIELAGFDKIVSTDQSNLAVDVALVALQMILPMEYSRHIRRMAGRTIPVNIVTVYRTTDHVYSDISWQKPGLGIPTDTFNHFVEKNESILQSVGRRVKSYIHGAECLPKLNQSWSDAAYWFHEALAEPLATVAVPKLETAIEVLFTAGSSTGSEKRLKMAFNAFFGAADTDRLRSDSPETVGDFIKSVVKTRSRILHGTWSTLAFDPSISEDAGRQILEMLVVDLLRRMTTALDEYAKDPKAVDNIEPFFNWIEVERKKGRELSIIHR